MHVALFLGCTATVAQAFIQMGPSWPAALERRRDAASSFDARVYKPPRWGFNAHVQTIWGSGELQRKVLGKEGPKPPYKRERFELPDGDFLDVDFLGFTSNGKDEQVEKLAILTHGLESSSVAPLTAKMALAFEKEGFAVAVLCFRSCSGEDNRKIGAYHLGFTDDLKFVVETMLERQPSAKIVLSGFSLGGNVIAKFLGELGEKAAKIGIAGAAVACVPYDAVACQRRIDSGFNRMVYSKNFLTSLVPKAKRKAETHPEMSSIVDMERLKRVRTVGEFDDAFIAPVYGFKDFQDYYRQSQSGPWLKHVRVPLLALQALDDPFMQADTYPKESDLKGAPVRLVYHRYGGHCAFVSADTVEQDRGWLPEELARFGAHVYRQFTALQVQLQPEDTTGTPKDPAEDSEKKEKVAELRAEAEVALKETVTAA